MIDDNSDVFFRHHLLEVQSGVDIDPYPGAQDSAGHTPDMVDRLEVLCIFRSYRPISPQQWNLMQKHTPCITVIISCSSWLLVFVEPATVHRRSLSSIFEPLLPLFPKEKGILAASSTSDHVALFHWLNEPSSLEIAAVMGDVD